MPGLNLNGIFQRQADPPVFQAPQPDLRDFGDTDSARRLIFDHALNAVRGVSTDTDPIDNTRFKLELNDINYIDPDKHSLVDQKRAILEGGTLSRRMRGTWRLRDSATGNVVSERKATLASIPYMTQRGTFILNGTEYTLSNQMRLRPGIFTRIKNNGELDVHVNILPGKGIQHHYEFNPENNVFKLRIGQASMPLLPLVRAMGVKDEQVREAWGNEIYAANARSDDGRVIDKLFTQLVRKPDPLKDKHTQVAEAFRAMQLDEEVTKRTLGQPFKSLNEQAIIAATRKLLSVHRRETDPDDRDHLAYQTFMGPEDLIAERLRNSRPLLRQALYKATFKGNLDSMPSGLLNKAIQAAVLNSGLWQAAEEINPSEIFDQQTRVTRLGEGGIPGIRAVPDEARSVQPSHLGFVDPARTPESFKIGVDSRIAYATRKGSDGKLYAPFIDAKTRQRVYRSTHDIADSIVAFPEEMDRQKPVVAAMDRGKLKYVLPHQVDLILPHMENAFSPLANMIPAKSASKAQRLAMGSRMMTQALPVKFPEAPWVQAATPDNLDQSFEEKYGRYMGAIYAPERGRVRKVDANGITVAYDSGKTETHELYNNHPYNRKTLLHNTALVQPGDMVQPNQLLAKSNYTDDRGTTALGLNARVAYLPYRGWNFEDAIVISQGMADRATSEHMYSHDIEWDERSKPGKRAFVSIFPTAYDKTVLDTIDDEGIVKPGTVVNYDSPLILNAREREVSHNQIVRTPKAGFTDSTLKWEHMSEGIVTDVAKTKKGVLVTVKAYSPMQVGDKMSGRYGDKGVIAAIVPDSEMPQDGQGRPFEVLLSPLSIVSRTNPSQMIEAALGKISERTGKPYKLNDFSGIHDLAKYALDELRRHNLDDIDDVIDPTTQSKIPGVFTGNRFFMKLHHTSESKAQGRGTGGYTIDDAPAKGGAGGAKRVSLMDVNALLSHGATEVLRDAKLIRGQRNEDFWQAYMSGSTPPEPNIPFVYEKFVNMLRGAGVNPVREGSRLHVMALTDADVDHLSGDRELKNVDTVDWKGEMKPKPGGLFDSALTGGNFGNRWAHIKLVEPMPNPVMEEPIVRILGLTKDQFEGVLSGTYGLNARGKLIHPDAKHRTEDWATGPQALKQALANINLDKEIERAKQDIKGGRKTARDDAVRRLQYLDSAKKSGLHPKDWIMSKVPVLPPIFRPVQKMMGTDMPIVGDANALYSEVWTANKNLKEATGKFANLADERLALYKSFKAVTGLGAPTHPKHQQDKVKGLLEHIFGPNPKFGMVQRKLLSVPVDVVGRSTIIPNPDLDMDSIGLPEETAWETYKPFIIRSLVRRGVPRIQAADMVKDQHAMAREVMVDEMKTRPVVIHRAPVLHKYGFMAFYPQLTKGHVLQVNPFIVKGFGADFDGDAMNFHVPVSEEARQEAVDKMLPSRNLLNVSAFDVHYMPITEHAGGLYSATARHNKQKRSRVFDVVSSVIAAYNRGELDVSDPVEVMQS